MPTCISSQSPVVVGRRAQDVASWVTKWQMTMWPSLVAVFEDDNLTLKSAANGYWLASAYWGADRIVVIEIDDDTLVYEFQDMKPALVFLDAVLLSHAPKMDELSQGEMRA